MEKEKQSSAPFLMSHFYISSRSFTFCQPVFSRPGREQDTMTHFKETKRLLTVFSSLVELLMTHAVEQRRHPQKVFVHRVAVVIVLVVAEVLVSSLKRKMNSSLSFDESTKTGDCKHSSWNSYQVHLVAVVYHRYDVGFIQRSENFLGTIQSNTEILNRERED